MTEKTCLVTGGAGFIGSHFLEMAVREFSKVIVLDALTYAGHKINLEPSEKSGNLKFVQGDICDHAVLSQIFSENCIDRVFHFAAESHVDRSISGPSAFIETNIMGTHCLLEHSLKHWKAKENDFLFCHVSTDEVFGELGATGYFTEESPYLPHSPYSASKASSDHLVRAYSRTYGLPVIISNCSNNYGPRQFPEKLIPVVIQKALKEEKIPVYGKGENIRDWIYVKDHCQGILLASQKGTPGETYCFGGRAELKNLELVEILCEVLDSLVPRKDQKKYSELIEFVSDRPGHDFRYAIDDTKAETKLGFKRSINDVRDGMKQTAAWYIENSKWCETVVGENK